MSGFHRRGEGRGKKTKREIISKKGIQANLQKGKHL
jgi:hypothetical protein